MFSNGTEEIGVVCRDSKRKPVCLHFCICPHSSRMRAAARAASLPWTPLVLTVAARCLSNWAAGNLRQTFFCCRARASFVRGLFTTGPLVLLSAS